MDFLRVGLSTLFSIVALFLVTRLLGYRQVNQLSMFDYVNGITIGSIAAELAVAQGQEFWFWTEALVLYGAITVLLSLLTDRFIRVRRLVAGVPIFLMRRGVLFDQNFKQAKLDLNEFQMQLRNQGYFDLDDLDTVLYETNGKLSILPKAEHRPTTPKDLSAAVVQEEVPVNVILDGQVLADNLKACGKDQHWLDKQLDQAHVSLSQVFLGFYNNDGGLSLYKRGGTLENRVIE